MGQQILFKYVRGQLKGLLKEAALERVLQHLVKRGATALWAKNAWFLNFLSIPVFHCLCQKEAIYVRNKELSAVRAHLWLAPDFGLILVRYSQLAAP